MLNSLTKCSIDKAINIIILKLRCLLLNNGIYILKKKRFFVFLQANFSVKNIRLMADNPSYNGIGSSSKTVLRTTRKEPENRVSTQRPAPSTPSPRGHA